MNHCSSLKSGVNMASMLTKVIESAIEKAVKNYASSDCGEVQLGRVGPCAALEGVDQEGNKEWRGWCTYIWIPRVFKVGTCQGKG